MFESMFGLTATPEQALVLCLKLQGCTHEEIASNLDVAPRTVTRWITVIRNRITEGEEVNDELGKL